MSQFKNDNYFPRDEPNIELIGKMVDEDLFFPSSKELKVLKDWVVFEMEDILTYHDEDFRQFRGLVRSVQFYMCSSVLYVQ